MANGIWRLAPNSSSPGRRGTVSLNYFAGARSFSTSTKKHDGLHPEAIDFTAHAPEFEKRAPLSSVCRPTRTRATPSSSPSRTDRILASTRRESDDRKLRVWREKSMYGRTSWALCAQRS